LAIRRPAIILTLLLAGSCTLFAAQLPCRSEAEYRALLGSVAQRLNAPAASGGAALAGLADEVPEQCNLSIAGHAFAISNHAMRKEMRALAAMRAPESRGPRLQALQASVRHKLDGLDAFERGADPAAQAKLQQIMSAREFRRVGGQDPRALLQEQLMRLLERFFALLGKNPRQAAFAAKLVAWTLCLVLAAFVIRALYRWAVRRPRSESVPEAIASPPSAKSWGEWLNEARAAAAAGELRQAVHGGYWAVISHLESSGAWRPDRARTPREYLRLLAQSSPARPLLGELTREFEAVWYGNRTPGPVEWQTFLAKVEQMGCR
jgi:Domain of unknown function (DUF4129)